MNFQIHAVTPRELRAKLDADLKAIAHEPSLTNAEWYERQQLWRFLRAASETDLLHYPLTIEHTSRINPDFRLTLPDSTIGIEASRIATEAYLRLNALRAEGKTPAVLGISHTLLGNDPMNNNDLVAGTAPGRDWNPPTKETDFWVEHTRLVVDKKTRIRRSSNYADYGENWLLLWDILSFAEEDYDNRIHLIHCRLRSYWETGKVFDRIVFECKELTRFSILTRQGIQCLSL
jgi:hypothetical protein